MRWEVDALDAQQFILWDAGSDLLAWPESGLSNGALARWLCVLSACKHTNTGR